MHYKYSSHIRWNRITNHQQGNGVTKISHRRQKCSSSISRTWRAKTVKESSKAKGHSSFNTVQRIATIVCFVFFYIILKTELSTVEENKCGHVQNCLWQKVPCPVSSRMSVSREPRVFTSPSAHFSLPHEMDVVDAVRQLGILVN